MEITSGIFGALGRFCMSFNTAEVDRLLDYLEEAYHFDRTVFLFGNGGSAATASHLCEDLGKGTLKSKNETKRLRIISLTDNTPYILAWANDEGYETIFEQQLRNLARPGDLAIGISGSGNSKNVLRAVEYADAAGLVTIGMTGFDGGQLRNMVDHCVHVPIFEMGMVECMHMIIGHYLVNSLRQRLHQFAAPEVTVVDNVELRRTLAPHLIPAPAVAALE